MLPEFELLFRLYIDVPCSQVVGAAFHQRQIVDGKPREGVIYYISRKLKDSEARLYKDCTALMSFPNMKTTNRHMLKWKIAIQEYRGNVNIIYKEEKNHTNADGINRWPLDNVKRNPAYDPEAATKFPINLM
ncbi:hypothetical protein O181_045604 [Austropuccinia psidii MF-1]|uniref:Uncharacterized protein n=1 Tax=Austropuccinia psidii MF-1 TaxID=1389203 RepID=A0A9Q3DMI6_9BASI|nr:hypothetical protein [Austropuccinia psidii MF-1]